MLGRRKLIDILIAVMTVAAGVSGFFMLHQSGSLQKVGLGATKMQQPAAVPSVFGTVEKVSGKEITLKDVAIVPVPASGQPANMTVVVDATTQIERIVPKDLAAVNKEQAAFVATLVALQKEGKLSATTPMTPPSPFTVLKLSLKDITVGTALTAFTAENLSDATTITATKIDLHLAPSSSTKTPMNK